MLGSVAEDGSEPLLPLGLLASMENATGSEEEVEAVIDTGFDGELTLPSGTIRRLGYPYAGSAGGTLADTATRSSLTTTRDESSGTEPPVPWP